MNILVIGCGISGKAIVRGIVNLDNVDNIYLYDKYPEVSKAFCDGMKNDKLVVVEDISKLDDLGYVIIVFSAVSEDDKVKAVNEKPSSYDMRQNQLKFNLEPMNELINVLDDYDDNVKVIVVTNPVDEFTNYLNNKLENKIVYGFGLDLDAYRYGQILDKDVFCIGLHGKAVPLVDFCSDEEYNELLNESDVRFTKILKERGVPAEQIELVFSDFFKQLISQGVVHLCHYVSSYLSAEDICISLPFKVKGGVVIDILDINVNDIEKKRFNDSVVGLKKSIDSIN